MTDPAAEIDALGWVHVTGGRLLGVRAQGKVAFYLPGGKREPGESDEQALTREVREELGVKLVESTLRPAGVFDAAADAHPAGTRVRLACYSAEFAGHLAASGEIAELRWLDRGDAERCAPAVRLVIERLVRQQQL